MAINNYKCENCEHSTLCKKEDKLVVFKDDAKKPLNINITMDDCSDFKEIGSLKSE
jgi:hypothetical protein